MKKRAMTERTMEEQSLNGSRLRSARVAVQQQFSFSLPTYDPMKEDTDMANSQGKEALKLGFGCMRLPLRNPDDPTDIDQEQFNRMVDTFMQAGFTYFDTAYPYHRGQSETALRKALVERYPRDAYTVTDKAPTWAIRAEEDYERIFQEQLDRTGLEYFDYYWLHNLGVDFYAIAERTHGFDFLKKIKADGRAKHIGFSFHDKPELLEQILQAHPEVEIVQLQINYIDWESPVIQARRNYEVCVKYGKPVVVMEPVKGGGLATLPAEAEALLREKRPDLSNAAWAIRFAASLPNVMKVLSGMTTLPQVEDNVSFMRDFQPLSDEEKTLIGQVTDIYNRSVEIPCTACRYCVDDCPKKIDIPTYFALYNYQRHLPGLYQRATVGHGKAGDCIRCRQCERHCPQHLPITSYLEKIAAHFGG